MIGIEEFVIDFDRVSDGIRMARDASVQLCGLQFDEPGIPSEVFVRGPDLIANYSQTKNRDFSLQVYWRMLQEPSGIELLLSAQTERLDALIMVQALHSLPGLRCYQDERMILLEQHEGDRPFILLRDESNIPGVLIEEFEKRTRITYECFQDHLEKGVIRRARMRIYWPPQATVADAKRLAHAFHEAELPLST